MVEISLLALNWLTLAGPWDRPPPNPLISQVNFWKGVGEKGEFEERRRGDSSLLAMVSLHLLVCVERCVCFNLLKLRGKTKGVGGKEMAKSLSRSLGRVQD